MGKNKPRWNLWRVLRAAPQEVSLFALWPKWSYSSQVADIISWKIIDNQWNITDARTKREQRKYISPNIILTQTNRDTISSVSWSNIWVLPIANQLRWVVAWNMELLHFLLEQGEDIYIKGWYWHRIRHILACLKSDCEGNITDVYSHKQALLQCDEEISRRWYQIHEKDSTTQHIPDLMLWQWVVCSEEAARNAGLQIVERQFCPKDNTTYFAMLSGARKWTLPGLSKLDRSRRVFTIDIWVAWEKLDDAYRVFERYKWINIQFQQQEWLLKTELLTWVLQHSHVTIELESRLKRDLEAIWCRPKFL